MNQNQLEMIKRMIVSGKVWVIVTQFDRRHNVINMLQTFRNHIPDGEIRRVGSNRAFFRPAKFDDFQYIIRHLDDGRGKDYISLLYYGNGRTTKLRSVLHFVGQNVDFL